MEVSASRTHQIYIYNYKFLDYSDLKAVRILNSELADTLGNLLSRCCSQSLNSNQVFPKINPEAYHEISSMDVTQKVVGHISALPGLYIL